MGNFRFRLEKLHRLREAARNSCRAQLAEAYALEDVLSRELADVEREIAALQDRVRQASSKGTVDVDLLLDAQRFDLELHARRQLSQQRHAVLMNETERRRQALVVADREVRVLDRLRQRRKAEHEYEEMRHESKLLDEIAARPRQREESE